MGQDHKTAIRDFVVETTRATNIADDLDMFAAGIVNSLFAAQLVLFVEKEFRLSLGEEDLEMTNFNTIEAIAALVRRKNEGS